MQHEQEWFEQLGELGMTEYYRTLSKLIGIEFDVHWTSINPCEQQAWIAQAKMIATVAVQYKHANDELSLLPGNGIGSPHDTASDASGAVSW